MMQHLVVHVNEPFVFLLVSMVSTFSFASDHYAVIAVACVQAKDMELYLDRVWQIPLPAFGHRGISAAPKYNADSTDAKYRSAVRAALSALQPKDAQKKPDDKGTSTPPGRPEDGARSQNE